MDLSVEFPKTPVLLRKAPSNITQLIIDTDPSRNVGLDAGPRCKSKVCLSLRALKTKFQVFGGAPSIKNELQTASILLSESASLTNAFTFSVASIFHFDPFSPFWLPKAIKMFLEDGKLLY